MSSKLEVKNGEVYLIDLKDTYPNVQKGVRPCLVVQNDFGNMFSPTIIVVPITTKLKKTNMPVHVLIKNHGANKSEMILCECVITISKSQIRGYIEIYMIRRI